LEERRLDVFARGSDAATLGPAGEVSLHDVSIFDLISAFNDVLKKVKKEELKEIFAERYTVAEKIDEIVNKIKTHERVSFSSLFIHVVSRYEIVCTFLAILELIRLKQIVARQEKPFGDILIVKAEG